jgi:hypothetical protein
MEIFKGRVLDRNQKVDFYRCLNRKGFTFSIKQNGKVVAHTDKIVLKDCELIVNKSGKKRCIETKSRNVHAFIRGFIGQTDDIKLSFSYILNYNPYKETGFNIQGTEIDKCDVAYIQGNNIYCQI